MERSLRSWEKEEIKPRLEADLRCHLFSDCLRLMKERNCAKPYEISVEKVLTKREKPDLTLGYLDTSGERWAVVVEIKWVGSLDKVTKGSVEKDMRKLAKRRGIFCYMALIDETTRYRKEIEREQFGMYIHEELTRTIKRHN